MADRDLIPLAIRDLWVAHFLPRVSPGRAWHRGQLEAGAPELRALLLLIDRRAALPGLASEISADALQRGVVLLAAGSFGNVIRFLPSLEVTDGEIDYVMEVIEGFLAARSS